MDKRYRIRKFSDTELSEGLADEIEEQLIDSRKAELTEDTQKKLARWCRTNGPPYQDAMPIAQQISRMLYGEVIDREVLGT